jgi:hypothetical protein
MSKWRTMKSAPKDRPIVVVMRDNQDMEVVWWEDGNDEFPWRSSYTSWSAKLPSHWLELPKPPKSTPA